MQRENDRAVLGLLLSWLKKGVYMQVIKVDKIRSYQTLVYKRGYKSFRTKEYKDYIKEISSQLDLEPTDSEEIRISIHFKNKNKVLGDLDNITKPLLDILQMNKIIKDDRYIVELNLKKSYGNEENTIELEIR